MATYPPKQSVYPPPPSHPIYPPPPASPQASPFTAVVPSPAVFPPGTDPNAVACFHFADRDGTRYVDDKELQKGLSLYHHSFSRRVIRLLIYIHTNSYDNKIGPTEFVQMYNSLVNWKTTFEKYDHDRNGTIDASELSNALMSFGYAVTPLVLDKLVSKFGKSQGKTKGIEYDYFIECCLTLKALSDMFREKDTTLRGSVDFEYETFMCNIIPYMAAACLPDDLSNPPKAPSHVVFPPDTDPNAVACFLLADHDGTGVVDDKELQKGLSLYHHSFNRRTIRFLIYVHTNSYANKIGPTEFVEMYNSLVNWKATFEKYDRDHSGTIDASELGDALMSFGYAVTPLVLENLISKFGKVEAKVKGIDYDNFIECCLTIKGLSDRYREKDTLLRGSVNFEYESFMCTILPFMVGACLSDDVALSTPSHAPNSYPPHRPPSSSPYPLSHEDENNTGRSCQTNPSPFTAVLPSPVVFPPGTDPNAVACFHSADHDRTGFIDDKELQKSLSLYHYRFSLRTIRLLIYIHTNSYENKIGPAEFVQLYNSLLHWKATFEKYDRDRSGTIEASELGDALMSFGYAVTPPVLQRLISKFGEGETNDKGIEYDYFIECCLTLKGLSDRFREKDTMLRGSVNFEYELFMCTIIPLISGACLPTETFPNRCPVVFPPGTDLNAVACFQLADHNGTGFVDDKELQKSLSLYHHSFNRRTILLLIYIHTNSYINKIGPTEFVQMYNSLVNWKATFEKYDHDHNGKIDASELGAAFMSFGYAVTPLVLEKLVSKFGIGEGAVEYEYFIECCLIIKGLSDRFREKDTTLCGSASFEFDNFLCTIIPFLVAACLPENTQPNPASNPQTKSPCPPTPQTQYPYSARAKSQSSYPSSPHAYPTSQSPHPYCYPTSPSPNPISHHDVNISNLSCKIPPPSSGSPHAGFYPSSAQSSSPFTAIVPSPAVFPLDTDANAVACFQMADHNGTGFIDDKELQKSLSLYHHSFNRRTICLLIYIHTNSHANKIGPVEFVQLYNNLVGWKATFEKYDHDHSGTIDASELGDALMSFGYAVSPPVLQKLVSKYGKGEAKSKAIHYDYFIECCVTVKGLSDRFRERDTNLRGSVAFGYESFMCTIVPFMAA